MKIGIVIPVINNWGKFTKPAIDSIKSKHDLYFVIVDNRSKDNTTEEAMKLVNENFHYKRNEDNLGCAESWNYGMKDCFINHGCDYVFIGNNDILLHPEAIDRLVERFEIGRLLTKQVSDESPKGSVFDGIQDNLVMVTCINVRGDCDNIPNNIFGLDVEKWKDTEESEHPDFSGFMVNRKFFEEVGEFDDGYSKIGKAYFEDNDIHRRIKLAGLKAINCPQALFYHYISGSKPQTGVVLLANQKFESNRDYFIGKWGGMPEPDGSLTDRLWIHPFNDESKNWKWTLQSESEEKQKEIISKYKKW